MCIIRFSCHIFVYFYELKEFITIRFIGSPGNIVRFAFWFLINSLIHGIKCSKNLERYDDIDLFHNIGIMGGGVQDFAILSYIILESRNVSKIHLESWCWILARNFPLLFLFNFQPHQDEDYTWAFQIKKYKIAMTFLILAIRRCSLLFIVIHLMLGGLC